MATLLLRLSAPLQAWGTQSNFTNRDSGREPSKSGVIGLLCAAIGRPRSESIDDLTKLKMGVRVDQEGIIRKDFQTAGMNGIYKVDGTRGNDLVVSQRYFLSDARFLVGLEGDHTFLAALQGAFQQPRWLLYLGRKSFIPAERIWLPDGVLDADVYTSLATYRWQGVGQAPARLRLILDDPNGNTIHNDLPLTFEPSRFIARTTRTVFVETPLGDHDVPLTLNT